MASEHRQAVILYSDAPRGQCRWCGKEILRANGTVNRRRRWHHECLEVYNLSYSAYARGKVWKRDQGVCAECRTQCDNIGEDSYGWRRNQEGELEKYSRHGWQNDHIVELVDGGTHTLDNMQTLCIPCHKKKTAETAGERARVRQHEKAGWTGDLFDALKGE